MAPAERFGCDDRDAARPGDTTTIVTVTGSPHELVSELDPITRIILIQMRNDLGFADENARLAAHPVRRKSGERSA